MKSYVALALSALTLVVGWPSGGGKNTVHAQSVAPGLSRTCFEIPHEARLDGRPVPSGQTYWKQLALQRRI